MHDQHQSDDIDYTSKQQLYNDHSNSAPTVIPTYLCDNNNSVDTSREISIKLLNEAIEETIPYHEKTGYMGALQRCPHLIEEESDPSEFLRYEQLNIWAAARRLVRYWEWRAIIFGDTYAYTPIVNLKVQKELGNLDFLSILQDGALIVLPGQDVYGNYLVYFDKWRFHLPFEEMDNMRILRIVFYTWTLMIVHSSRKNKNRYQAAAAREGGVILIDMFYEVPSTTKHFIETGTNLHSLLTEAVPFDAPIQHIMFMANKKTDWTALIGIVAPVVLSTVSQFFTFFKKIIPHFCSDAQSALNELTTHGIADVGCLPESIGGSWPLSEFDRWFQNQLDLSECTYHLGTQQKEGQQNYFTPDIPTLFPQQPLVLDNPLSIEGFTKQDVDGGYSPFKMNSFVTGDFSLNDEDIQTLGTQFVVSLLSTKLTGHFLLFIDPVKAENCTVASQRRCFAYCLNCLVDAHSKSTLGTGSPPEVSIFVFIDDDKSNSSASSSTNTFLACTTNASLETMTFSDILQSSPVCLSSVHVMLEPVLVGWLDYQESAKVRVIQLFNPPIDLISFDTLYPGSVSVFQENGIDQASIPFILGSRWNDPNKPCVVELDVFRIVKRQSRPNAKRKSSCADENSSKESATGAT